MNTYKYGFHDHIIPTYIYSHTFIRHIHTCMQIHPNRNISTYNIKNYNGYARVVWGEEGREETRKGKAYVQGREGGA